MADWYLAPSLVDLRIEVNRLWPNRDRTSDGSIGDASHAARKSDHNPDWDAGGVVRAIDIDKDGIDVQALLDATIGDHRVFYVIWDRHIYSRTYGWKKRPYDGPNPHTKHVHISIQHTRAAETDTSLWFARKPAKPPVVKPPTDTNPEDEMTPAQMTELKNFIEARTQAYAIANNNYTRQVLATATKAILAAAGDDDATAAVAQLNTELDARDAEMQADIQAIADKLDEPETPEA